MEMNLLKHFICPQRGAQGLFKGPNADLLNYYPLMYVVCVDTEFLEVGKKQPALDVLYDVIKSKKHRTWQKIHEPIMEKYLELCVDLRKSHIAKEGLYQYKIICQQVK